jgi:predicted ester cyclase
MVLRVHRSEGSRRVAVVTEGDEVWAQTMIRGTQQGEFLGVPASSRRVEVAGIDRLRFRDGKVVEHWGVTDILSLMQQVGAVPQAP